MPATVPLAGSTARITGTVKTRSGPVGGPGSVDADVASGSVEVFIGGQTTPVTTVTVSGGVFTYDATSTGVYRFVAAAPSGHVRREQRVEVGPAAARHARSRPAIVMPKLRHVRGHREPVVGARLTVQPTGTPTVAPAVTPSSDGFEVAVDPGGGDGSNVPATPPSYAFRVVSTGGYVRSDHDGGDDRASATEPVTITWSPARSPAR